MIRPLRARHRHMFLILTLLVGFLMVAGLAARRVVPAIDAVLQDLVGV